MPKKPTHPPTQYTTKKNIEFTLKRNVRSRSVTIRVLPSGTVLVTAPPRANIQQILTSVDQSSEWIQKHTKRQKRKEHSATPYLQLYGEQWLIRPVQHSAIDAPAVEFSTHGLQRELRVLDLYCQTQPVMLKTIARHLKIRAEHDIRRMVKEESARMNTAFTSITIRDTSSRWGSCSSTGSLSFSWRLIHMPPAVMRYVVIHELAHLDFMDHSTRFWKLVEKYDPEYKLHKKYLKQHAEIGRSLELTVQSAFALYNNQT